MGENMISRFRNSGSGMSKALLALITFLLVAMPVLAQQPTVAVLDLEAKYGLEQDIAGALSDRLRQELFRTGEFNVVERARMDAILSEQGLGMVGITSQDDMVKAGRMLNVNMIVAGSISKIGSIYTLTVRMFSVETAELMIAESKDCQCTIEEVMMTQIAEMAKLLAGTAENSGPSISGNPNLPGRLEYIYSGMSYTAMLDGEVLEASNDMKAIREVGHGKHLLQIHKIKGMFSSEVVAEENINIPGGYIVRATYRDDGLQIIETVPIPGMQQQATQSRPSTPTQTQNAGGAQTTTTQTTQIEHSTPEVTMQFAGQSVTLPGMGVSVTETSTSTYQEQNSSTLTMEEPPPPPSRPSKVVFMSEEGMCEIYLDGKQKAEIGIPDIDELGQATVFDLMPGTYILKIEGFEVWYEGSLQVGSGEEIKIRVEPNRFNIIGRNPLPY